MAILIWRLLKIATIICIIRQLNNRHNSSSKRVILNRHNSHSKYMLSRFFIPFIPFLFPQNFFFFQNLTLTLWKAHTLEPHIEPLTLGKPFSLFHYQETLFILHKPSSSLFHSRQTLHYFTLRKPSHPSHRTLSPQTLLHTDPHYPQPSHPSHRTLSPQTYEAQTLLLKWRIRVEHMYPCRHSYDTHMILISGVQFKKIFVGFLKILTRF